MGVMIKETFPALSQSLQRPGCDEINPQHSTIMQQLRTPGRTEKEQSKEMGKKWI